MSAQHAAAVTAEIPATSPTQLLPPVEDLRRAALVAGILQSAPGPTPRGTAARPEWPDLSPAAATGAAGPGRTLPWWLGRRTTRHPIRHRAGRAEPYTRPIPIPGRGRAPRHRRGGTTRAILVSLTRLLCVPLLLAPFATGWAVGLPLCIEAVGVWPW